MKTSRMVREARRHRRHAGEAMEKELEKRLEDDTRFKQAVSEAAKRYNIGVLIVGTMSAGAAADEFGSLLIHGHDDLDKLKELHAFVTESVEGALRGEREGEAEYVDEY